MPTKRFSNKKIIVTCLIPAALITLTLELLLFKETFWGRQLNTGSPVEILHLNITPLWTGIVIFVVSEILCSAYLIWFYNRKSS